MKIAIAHYHLDPGGVSSVACAQASLLREGPDADDAILVASSPPRDGSRAPFHRVPGLAYDSSGRGPAGATSLDLANEIQAALARAFPGGADLLIFHNPLIAKNRSLIGALRELSQRGLPLLLEIHDFAEDFRPDVYASAQEYPEDCLYAALGTRDRVALAASGLGSAATFLLPNPIAEPSAFEPRLGYAAEVARGRNTVLYPVRAIGRKNLGEALLLSLFLPEGAEIAVTLPPKSPFDLPTYNAWKNLAARKSLRIRFEAGLGASLEELYSLSYAALSVSVKEGFGYAFVEPSVRGLPLVGRAIPHLAADFRSSGLALSGLYDELRVPASDLALGPLEMRLEARIAALRSAYAPALPAERLGPMLDRLRSPFLGTTLDFGRLDPSSQADYVELLAENQNAIRRFQALNPFVGKLLLAQSSPELLTAERDAAVGAFSPARHRALLREACRKALEIHGCAELEASPVGGGKNEVAHRSIDKARLLERMLVPEGFFLGAG